MEPAAHKERIRKFLTAFLRFFGMLLENTVLQKYWEKPEHIESNKKNHFREMFNGLPSDVIDPL